MNVAAGIGLIVGGSLLALGVVFVGRRRLKEMAFLALLAACGVTVGAGALLVQDEANAAEWAATLLALGLLTPLHARLVFDRPARRR